MGSTSRHGALGRNLQSQLWPSIRDRDKGAS